MIWGRFAASCIDLGLFCCVLQRFGVVLLRSAMIWGSFLAFCSDLVQFFCVLQRFGGSFAAFCSDFGSFCCVLQRFGAVLLRYAKIWVRFAPFCSDLVLML